MDVLLVILYQSCNTSNYHGAYKLNILIDNNKCPNCDNEIGNGALADYFTLDKHHDEMYCNKCGLVVRNNELPTIADLEFVPNLNSGDQ